MVTVDVRAGLIRRGAVELQDLDPSDVEALLTIANSLHRTEGAPPSPDAGHRGEELDRLQSAADATRFFEHISAWYRRNSTTGWTPPVDPVARADLAELRLLRKAVRELAAGSLERYEALSRQLCARHDYSVDAQGQLLIREAGWRGFIARLLPTLIALRTERARLRRCANPQCRWIMLDRSRSGERRWCSMRACGNRAKVRRFRQRERGRYD
jgi:predicted RNA-binding Zn ribbon-like protein